MDRDDATRRSRAQRALAALERALPRVGAGFEAAVFAYDSRVLRVAYDDLAPVTMLRRLTLYAPDLDARLVGIDENGRILDDSTDERRVCCAVVMRRATAAFAAGWQWDQDAARNVRLVGRALASRRSVITDQEAEVMSFDSLLELARFEIETHWHHLEGDIACPGGKLRKLTGKVPESGDRCQALLGHGDLNIRNVMVPEEVASFAGVLQFIDPGYGPLIGLGLGERAPCDTACWDLGMLAASVTLENVPNLIPCAIEGYAELAPRISIELVDRWRVLCLACLLAVSLKRWGLFTARRDIGDGEFRRATMHVAQALRLALN